jgi:hypothetical protein
MEAMLGISLYSFPYLNYQNHLVFLIIDYVFSSTKLEERAGQVLPASEGRWGEEGGGAWRGGRNGPTNKCSKTVAVGLVSQTY